MSITSKDIVPLKEMRSRLAELAEEVCQGKEKIITRRLFGQAIPALEHFPDLGTDFFRHRPTSREAAVACRKAPGASR